MENVYDIIIIGGGPAGLTSGIYTSRAKLKTLILDEGIIGGQMVLTHEIANYPGFESISGYKLATEMKNQAMRFGCDILENVNIIEFNLTGSIKEVVVNKNIRYFAKTIIFATGGKPRELGVVGEKEFKGKGISYCATCDGDFFQDKEIVVIGGGNSALEEADSLTKYAKKVTIVHQFNYFQAFAHAVEIAKVNDKIDFLMESKVVEFMGENSLSKIKVQSLKNNSITELEAQGAFVFIGYEPNTSKLKNIITLNERKEIIVDSNMKTNIEGVYAAGDSVEKKYRQITIAVGEGTLAALNAIEYVYNHQIKNH